MKFFISDWLKENLVDRLSQGHDYSNKKAGLPPGSLVYVGKRSTPKFTVEIIDYNTDRHVEQVLDDFKEAAKYKKAEPHTWINATGVDHVDDIKQFGELFDIHPLVLEDLVDTNQRPKIEEFDDYTLVIIKMLSLKTKGSYAKIESEQVSLLLSDGWLISFQEQEGDVWDRIRDRLRDEKSPLRKRSIDYLYYRLIDTIIDNYFSVTEHISASIEELESDMMENLSDEMRWKMQAHRKDLIQLRKAVAPLREIISSLSAEESKFIRKNTKQFLRDIHDHVMQLNDYIDTQRDMLSSLGDLYLSGVSHKMNQVMKVLTIISTIFIPLTFIAGIYGMNFQNIPELSLQNGYYYTWGLMIAVAIVMMIFFKRKGWW